MRVLVDNLLLPAIFTGFGTYENSQAGLRDFINEFENTYSGDIIISFYIDRADEFGSIISLILS